MLPDYQHQYLVSSIQNPPSMRKRPGKQNRSPERCMINAGRSCLLTCLEAISKHTLYGGIIDPPKIIIIRKAEPWLVYFPNPAIANANMEGHIIEQHKPPLMKANNPTRPVVINPTTMANTPSIPNMVNVRTGFC